MRRRLIVFTAATALILGSPLLSWATDAPPPAPPASPAKAAPKKPATKAAPKKKAPAKAAAPKKTTAESAGIALLTFCDEWMHKLELREHDNLEHIKWETTPEGVQGTYTAYSKEHTCKLVEGTEQDPVAKIMYREERSKKQGHTIAEAQQSTPEVIDVFEVQEIFHYLKAKGKWDY